MKVMKHLSAKLVLGLLALSPINFATAENLLDIYQLAKEHDPTIQAAYEKHHAELEAVPQARALLLPSISANSNTKFNKSSDDVFKKYNSWYHKLTISQPIFRFSDWSQLAAAKNKEKAAIAVLADAEQSLLFKISSQYFAILKATDNLNFSKAERKAFARHLEQSKQRFKVGLIAITDVHEAQAKHDSAYAREIAAESLIADEKEKLRITTEQAILSCIPLKKSIKLLAPIPKNMEQWVNTATKQNWQLQAARFNLAATKEKIRQRSAGHYPTLQLGANLTRSKDITLDKTTAKDIGVTLSIPLFSGGNVLSKTKEARFNYEEATKKLEQQYRKVESDTRQAYRGVLTQISKAKAFKQAVLSSQSALKATQAAFDVGTRTIVEVLNAQSDVLNAKKDYSKARYDYILQSLKLKQTAGILSFKDLQEINTWLGT